ncbi:MAG: NAD(P)H-hydrate epimerase [Actinomycetota bacterium]
MSVMHRGRRPAVPSFPSINPSDTAWITTDQMREVDRRMIDVIGIELLQMMENAGRSLARVALATFDPARAVVLAGTGGNGGGGLAAARHLVNAGTAVSVVLTRSPDHLRPVPRRQYEALRAMGVPVGPAADLDPNDLVGADLLIDAIIGYSLTGPPTGGAAHLIEAANGIDTPVLSLDTPSGLDVTTGRASGPVVGADATLTLALPKVGLRAADGRGSRPRVGALYLADISVPEAVYHELSIAPVPSFRPGPILRIDPSDPGPGPQTTPEHGE